MLVIFLEDEVWDFNCLLECLPINIVNLILSTHAGYNGSGKDKCIWQPTSNGQFSVKTAYSTFYLDEGSAKWKWDFIWKLHVPPKVQTFLWLLCHKKLPTNAQRLKRKLTNVVDYPRCVCPLESCAHLFKDCTATLAIWNRLGFGRGEAGQLMDDYDDWLLHNLNSRRFVVHGLPWYLVFAIFLLFIWKWRCKVVFDQKFLLHADPHLLIYQYAFEWFSACNPMAILPERSVVLLHWMAPLPGVCKVNTDGSRINSSGLIGAGGLLRDSCGNWIKGFSVNLGYGSVIEAELWGIFWGLSMAWDAGFRTVEIECDATSAMALLKSPIVSTHPLFSIINCCKLKIHEDWCCSVKHIFREQNCAADALAVKCYDFAHGLHVFLEAPAFLSDVLAADVRGAIRPRLVSV
ncbi:PREDICTED: ribonuclease [Prunus dulcis]|uniref:PREDICTED: ribonuclease n=1 Tax=Prunus dulcis TaxID=3755 RepID=A0A5E4G6L5_PRUDU|nr:PREDICTED: ribonuclease [Prunus dulcis]